MRAPVPPCLLWIVVVLHFMPASVPPMPMCALAQRPTLLATAHIQEYVLLAWRQVVALPPHHPPTCAQLWKPVMAPPLLSPTNTCCGEGRGGGGERGGCGGSMVSREGEPLLTTAAVQWRTTEGASPPSGKGLPPTELAPPSALGAGCGSMMTHARCAAHHHHHRRCTLPLTPPSASQRPPYLTSKPHEPASPVPRR